MKNLTTVDSFIERIVEKKGLQQSIALFENSLQTVEILNKVIDILDKLCYHNAEALELCAVKITPYIKNYSEKYFHNAEAFKMFTLLSGTLCRNTPA